MADKASGKVTLAVLLNNDKANLAVSTLLNLLPFAMILVAVLTNYLSYAYLATLIILPRACWLLYSLKAFVDKKEIKFERPPMFLGRMENWEGIKQSGVDWFMMRWYCARNITSDFCLIVVVVNILLNI